MSGESNRRPSESARRQLGTRPLLGPPDQGPPSVSHLPCAKRIELWLELVATAEAFQLASLRDKVGPNGDVEAPFRDWLERQAEEHERRQIHFLEER